MPGPYGLLRDILGKCNVTRYNVRFRSIKGDAYDVEICDYH